MLKRLLFLLAGLVAVSACGAHEGHDQAAAAGAATKTDWKEGQHYFAITTPVPPTSGKVEVSEMFSYACPHCAHFQPFAEQIKAKLPPQATFVYVPVVFNPSWEPYARAYYAAQSLGVLDKSHQALFDALHRDHKPLRSIEDLAGFYSTFGVDAKNFISTAQSFVVEGQLTKANTLARSYEIQSTPTLIVNGKYRLDASSAGGQDQAVALALWLVDKEVKSAKK